MPPEDNTGTKEYGIPNPNIYLLDETYEPRTFFFCFQTNH